MYGVDTVSVSLRRDFGERLERAKEAHGGRSRRDDFFHVANELFPRYGEEGESLRDFMSRAAALFKKRKRDYSKKTPSPHRATMKELPKPVPAKAPPVPEAIQREILAEVRHDHPEPAQDIRPKPRDLRDLPAWKEVDGEVLPPDGTE